MQHCFDAAYPPHLIPPHCTAVLGYIGGPQAYRTWTLEEWQRFSGLHQFPAYVPDMSMSPQLQAHEAVNLMRLRGWHPGRALVADLETQVNKSWWQAFASAVISLEQLPVAYGSISTVARNGAGIIWSAHYDNVAVLDPGQAIEATQYASSIPYGRTIIDLSVVSDMLMQHAGTGPRQ